MSSYTFTTASEAIAVYGKPLIAQRKTLVKVRPVKGESEVFLTGEDPIVAISGEDYVVIPCDGSPSYPCKIDIFHKSWEGTNDGSGVYRRKALSRVIQVPPGDTVLVKTLEGDVSVSHPDYIAIGVDGEVYKNEVEWVKQNLEFSN